MNQDLIRALRGVKVKSTLHPNGVLLEAAELTHSQVQKIKEEFDTRYVTMRCGRKGLRVFLHDDEDAEFPSKKERLQGVKR